MCYDHVFIHKIDSFDIPKKLVITYCDVTGIKSLFNTELGKKIETSVLKNKTQLILIPTDSVGIDDNEIEYLFKNVTFFTKENVKFYQSWYDHRLKFNYHLSSTIHSALDFYINYVKTNKYDVNDKIYHFLTLNNKGSFHRKDLYNFYNDLNSEDKDKILCSFRFAGIYLDHIDGTELNNYDLVYGKTLIDNYQQCFVEIVSESSMISITEKSYKPMLSETPFIYWNTAQSHINYQLRFFHDIGIDVNYFKINYLNQNSIKNKIIEILNTPKADLFVKYDYAFKLAAKNKIKILNFIESLEKELIS